MRIVPVRDNVIFQFVDDITSKRFINNTESGVVLISSMTDQSSIPRWVKVTHVGPDVDQKLEVKVGDYAVVEPGMWTTGFKVDGETYWKTEPKKIMFVGDKPSATH